MGYKLVADDYKLIPFFTPNEERTSNSQGFIEVEYDGSVTVSGERGTVEIPMPTNTKWAFLSEFDTIRYTSGGQPIHASQKIISNYYYNSETNNFCVDWSMAVEDRVFTDGVLIKVIAFVESDNLNCFAEDKTFIPIDGLWSKLSASASGSSSSNYMAVTLNKENTNNDDYFVFWETNKNSRNKYGINTYLTEESSGVLSATARRIAYNLGANNVLDGTAVFIKKENLLVTDEQKNLYSVFDDCLKIIETTLEVERHAGHPPVSYSYYQAEYQVNGNVKFISIQDLNDATTKNNKLMLAGIYLTYDELTDKTKINFHFQHATNGTYYEEVYFKALVYVE